MKKLWIKIKMRLLKKTLDILSSNFVSLTDARAKTLLNVGAGAWRCKGWINLDYPSDWYAKAQKKYDFIPYDIRKDALPFEDQRVDAIYCSHVIEHIEDEFVQNFFHESFRVLNRGGVLRIACPDCAFLYQVSKFENGYWDWRRDEWFSSSLYVGDAPPRPVDYLVREIATPILPGYINTVNSAGIDYIEQYASMSMNDFFEYITKDLVFRENYVGDHINWWTFEKAKDMLQRAGFSTVIRSKYSASVCPEMRVLGKFDITFPVMSLYVEALR